MKDKDVALTYKVNDQITLCSCFTDGDTAASKDSGLGIRYTKDSWTMITLNYMETDADGATDYTMHLHSYSIDDKIH